MGYNNPMSTEPVTCECGDTPHLICLGDRPDKFSNHWLVFCECGMNGGVLMSAGLAVFIWGIKSARETTKEPWLSELRSATRETTE